MRRREKELRCFCRHKPLLATYGLDDRDRRFVHIKSWKQERLFVDLYIWGGVVKMRCRDCFRWHRVRIDGNSARLTEVDAPQPEAVAG